MEIPDIISYILSPELQEKLLPMRVIFIALSLIFIIGIILLTSKTTYLRIKYRQGLTEFSKFKPFGLRKLIKRWKRIKKRLDKNNVNNAKLAILEADKLVDDILKRLGYTGENLDDRLEKIDTNLVPSLEILQEIHITSKKISEHYDYYLTMKDSKSIIEKYEKVLQELQVF